MFANSKSFLVTIPSGLVSLLILFFFSCVGLPDGERNECSYHPLLATERVTSDATSPPPFHRAQSGVAQLPIPPPKGLLVLDLLSISTNADLVVEFPSGYSQKYLCFTNPKILQLRIVSLGAGA
jgi:hypothetical protein